MCRKGQHGGYSKRSKKDEWLKKMEIGVNKYYVVDIRTNQQKNAVSYY